jgi:signal transduction histidine kinase
LLLGLLTSVGATCGYLFVGSAANAQLRAETAHQESQRLLAELQAAHRQLQAYTARAEELAIEQERNRLSREVHDTLGHRLTIASVQLEGAQRLLSLAPEKAVAMLEVVREQVREGLTELRQTVAALRTPVEAELSLPSALLTLIQQFEAATGLIIQLELPTHLPYLTPEQHQTFYRTAQEALTNVQRHAEAKIVRLQLLDDPAAGGVLLTIVDDGRGLPPTEFAHGFGLRGLQERAEQLGGEFQVRTRETGGVELLLRLPYHKVAGDG